MSGLTRHVRGIGLGIAALGMMAIATLWWLNRNTAWNGHAAYLQQTGTPTGRAGVAVVALAMPERYNPVFFESFVDKLFSSSIPWPINAVLRADRGVALADPDNPMPTQKFEPRTLRDAQGRSADNDGVAWLTKYQNGHIRFVPPSRSTANDFGYFLYSKRKGNMPTLTAKLLLKARYVFYARQRDGYLPHFKQTTMMAQAALETLKSRHDLAAAEMVEAFNPAQMEKAVRTILDSGVDTLVLASVQPIYSDFEELRGSYAKVHNITQAWQKEHPNNPVKIMIAPYLATSESFVDLWERHLLNVTPPAPRKSASTAHVIVALHGLPASLLQTDPWQMFSRDTFVRLSPRLEAAMRSKGYSTVKLVRASESFADLPEDKNNEILSVREAFAQAVTEKADLAIALPVEFLAENTDTLYTHAALMFKDLPGYRPYQGPPVDVDWAKPYVRRFNVDNTMIIYAGALGGDAAPAAGVALADAISPLFAR